MGWQEPVSAAKIIPTASVFAVWLAKPCLCLQQEEEIQLGTPAPAMQGQQHCENLIHTAQEQSSASAGGHGSPTKDTSSQFQVSHCSIDLNAVQEHSFPLLPLTPPPEVILHI